MSVLPAWSCHMSVARGWHERSPSVDNTQVKLVISDDHSKLDSVVQAYFVAKVAQLKLIRNCQYRSGALSASYQTYK